MNIFIFSQRLRECRKRKFSSQQAFADAYVQQFGTIRKPKNKIDSNMFGTIQSWEQGKSTPTAEALSNICKLLDCDADYLLGRIDQRTHDINDAHRYTGLSPEALEQLHEYKMNLLEHPEPALIAEMGEHWMSHPYYQARALYLIDDLINGSKSHKLSAARLDILYEKISDQEIAVNPEDYGDASDFEDPSEDYREQWATECREFIDTIVYHVTNNIRDIIFENAVDLQLPKALVIKPHSKNTVFFSVDD